MQKYCFFLKYNKVFEEKFGFVGIFLKFSSQKLFFMSFFRDNYPNKYTCILQNKVK